jgi:hypothetical protein
MMKGAIALGAVLALLAAAGPAGAKDFPEPVLAVDPLAAASRRGAPAGMGGAFEYGNYLLAHDYVDSFYFRVGSSPVIFDLGDRFALGAIYESVLQCGPVKASAGEKASNVMAFWMNSVQFEYGLYASLALSGEGAGGARLLAEYSRSSQHPFSNRTDYSTVAADILMVGLSLPELRSGAFDARSYLRAGYRDMFAIWKSPLPKPRVSWLLKPAIEGRIGLGRGAYAIARAYPELFWDRYARRLDANIFSEAGLALGKGLDSSELLLTLYSTRNSDMLKYEVHPTFEAGLALRFSADRAR